eukprot:g22489.t1
MVSRGLSAISTVLLATPLGSRNSWRQTWMQSFRESICADYQCSTHIPSNNTPCRARAVWQQDDLSDELQRPRGTFGSHLGPRRGAQVMVITKAYILLKWHSLAVWPKIRYPSPKGFSLSSPATDVGDAGFTVGIEMTPANSEKKHCSDVFVEQRFAYQWRIACLERLQVPWRIREFDFFDDEECSNSLRGERSAASVTRLWVTPAPARLVRRTSALGSCGGSVPDAWWFTSQRKARAFAKPWRSS